MVSFYFPGFYVTSGYIVTSEDWELGTTNEGEHVAFVFLVWVPSLSVFSSSVDFPAPFMMAIEYPTET